MAIFDAIIGFFQDVWNSIYVLLFSSNNIIFSAIDILIVTFIVYKVIQFMHQTRAEQLIKGIIVFVIVYFIAELLQLNAVKWIISIVSANFLVVIVVLFQPELRAILEKIGRSGISALTITKTSQDNDEIVETIDRVCNAADSMHRTKTGSLIILERKTMLNEIVQTGTVIDSTVSTNLINNIFFKNSPLHDGAMIIRNNRICAASCILPLTQNIDVDSSLGTRHRAAIGLSEISDAIVIVVSEETGNISMALGGKLRRNYTKELLKTELSNLLVEKSENQTENKFLKFFRKRGGEENEKD